MTPTHEPRAGGVPAGPELDAAVVCSRCGDAHPGGVKGARSDHWITVDGKSVCECCVKPGEIDDNYDGPGDSYYVDPGPSLTDRAADAWREKQELRRR